MREVVMRREVAKGVRNFIRVTANRTTQIGPENLASLSWLRGEIEFLTFAPFGFIDVATSCTIMPPLLDPNLFHRLQSEMDEETEHKKVCSWLNSADIKKLRECIDELDRCNRFWIMTASMVHVEGPEGDTRFI